MGIVKLFFFFKMVKSCWKTCIIWMGSGGKLSSLHLKEVLGLLVISFTDIITGPGVSWDALKTEFISEIWWPHWRTTCIYVLRRVKQETFSCWSSTWCYRNTTCTGFFIKRINSDRVKLIVMREYPPQWQKLLVPRDKGSICNKDFNCKLAEITPAIGFTRQKFNLQ